MTTLANASTVSTLAIAGAATGYTLTGANIADMRTFHEVANAFDAEAVNDTVTAIRESFERRDTFEAANAIGKTSYTVNRDKVLNNAVCVARFLLALGVAPSAVIERKVSANAMFNAKALKKVVELAQVAVLRSVKLEKVMSAFIICALAYEARNSGAVSNKINKLFLSNASFKDIVADEELADYIADYQRTVISGGRDTQSSQARNVLDVLGLGAITHEERSRGALAINVSHSFFADFTALFCK